MGTNEIIVIGIAVLILFGGKRLPELLHSIGRFMADMRRITTQLKREAGLDVFDDIRNPNFTKPKPPKPDPVVETNESQKQDKKED